MPHCSVCFALTRCRWSKRQARFLQHTPRSRQPVPKLRCFLSCFVPLQSQSLQLCNRGELVRVAMTSHAWFMAPCAHVSPTSQYENTMLRHNANPAMCGKYACLDCLSTDNMTLFGPDAGCKRCGTDNISRVRA